MAMAGNRFFHVNINVTDLDRSIAFYRLFGFEVVFRQTLDPETSRETARAFDREPNGAEYALVRIGDDPRATCLDLVEWKTRPTEGRPYALSNNAGMYRILVHVEDAEAVLAALAAHGVTPMGAVIRATAVEGQPPTTMFCVHDPDGTVIEIASGLDHLVD
jgi:catechol 2,3-dioxygenase-like lactoylglutathione lyase family enzyme